MPESLTLDVPSASVGSSKRQRSADSRDARIRTESTDRSSFSEKSGKSLLRPNIRIPTFLDKSRANISKAFQDLEWKQRFRIVHAIQNPTTSPYRVDRSEIITSRNRYGNVQPWDQSRIKLKTPIGGSDYVNASPIILSSRVKPNTEDSMSDDDDGDDENSVSVETKYIASQGPKQGQYSHFWHMVHQETYGDTGAIIMLTKLYEGNKEKCAPYFPISMDNPVIELPHEEIADEAGEEPGSSATSDGEDPFLDNESSSGTDESEGSDNETPESTPQKRISESNEGTGKPRADSVTLLSIDNDSSIGCEVRKLDLTIDNSSKTIFHYLFEGWPDFGKPEAEERKALIELTRRSKQVAQNSPRVVHCSAGVGRTGTWIALDFLTREIDEGRLVETISTQQQNEQAFAANTEATSATPKGEVETWGNSGPLKVSTPTDDESSPSKDDDDLIYDTVNTLREQRMMMVMNELQFVFLYETLRDVFLDKYKAKPEGAMIKGGNDPDTDPPRSKVAKVDGSVIGPGMTDEIPSEAETEIMMEVEAMNDDDEDPYSAVAPEVIKDGMVEK